MCSRVRGFFLLGAILAAFANANGAELKEARVTQIVRDVKLLPECRSVAARGRERLGS